MIDIKRVTEIAERHLEGSDMFVVECKATPMGEIELLIDSDTAVRLEDCAALNRAIEAELDREVEDYSLMVASAGIGSELKLLRQYSKILGSSVEVLLKDGIKILAKLEKADQEGIVISYEEKQLIEGKKRKQTVEVTKEYKWEEIKYVKEYLDFK
ncbi:MAG: ribosome assembly cofactor RimP [Alistipes sp.]|uniref:ribosome assembly cofactor RimP n=1 Tax=Alistipes sp. TaxID=1872444 RepID=UPI001B5F22DA|nr:ribosome assembly cofactor RimP [Alistipes sp.]